MEKILLIDDEAFIKKMLKKLLETHNYEVLLAANGAEGIKLFNEHRPALIITDLIMPEQEGLETIMEIRNLNPDVKIIAMSGGGIKDPKFYLELAGKFGANHSFSKPIDNNKLLSTVKELLA